MKVILSPDARSYAKLEATYLKAHRPQAGSHFSDSLKRLRQHLSQFPHMGQHNLLHPDALVSSDHRVWPLKTISTSKNPKHLPEPSGKTSARIGETDASP